MTHALTFEIDELDKRACAFMPVIDGVRLAELVEDFEKASGYDDPAGGYGGVVPSHIKLGPIEAYLLGDGLSDEGVSNGCIMVLFCECGEAGCWPLEARVRTHKSRVYWDRFAQPHRPNRDYKNFGPFEFEYIDYQQAVRRLAEAF
uniref:hypothetical protein n=1 Tax=uncultured Altererythrobacter sp. TaxID=500840 RepID=UPI00261C8745|nr:hypothetical protein [uncultured Altererythrobacter sp.]